MSTAADANFNPQVPCGTRLEDASVAIGMMAFQSTGPLRDPTQWTDRKHGAFHISIHRSLAGPDDVGGRCDHRRDRFQSTGPLRDPTGIRARERRRKQFQSTGPLRDPTSEACAGSGMHGISIHRSLAGPDRIVVSALVQRQNFNPQVPCGTRRSSIVSAVGINPFQSTGPLRDPTILTARPEKSP